MDGRTIWRFLTLRATTTGNRLVLNMSMKDLSTPHLDKARFNQEFFLDIVMASSPHFPPMEEFDWDRSMAEFQQSIMERVIDRNADLFRRLTYL